MLDGSRPVTTIITDWVGKTQVFFPRSWTFALLVVSYGQLHPHPRLYYFSKVPAGFGKIRILWGGILGGIFLLAGWGDGTFWKFCESLPGGVVVLSWSDSRTLEAVRTHFQSVGRGLPVSYNPTPTRLTGSAASPQCSLSDFG